MILRMKMTPEMIDHKTYAKASAVDKARMERALWEGSLKGKSDKSMGEAVAEVLGLSDPSTISCRSNMLRFGTSDARIKALWVKIDEGTLSLQDAYRQARNLKRPKAKPKAKPKAPAFSREIKQAEQLKLRAEHLENEAASLKEAIEALSSSLAAPMYMPLPLSNTQVRELIVKVRDFLYEELSQRNYLGTDRDKVIEPVRALLVTLDIELRDLGRVFERLQGTRSRFKMALLNRNSLAKHFKTLGLPVMDVSSPDFSFDVVKATFKTFYQLHPDLSARPSNAFVQITVAYNAIRDAWYEVLSAQEKV